MSTEKRKRIALTLGIVGLGSLNLLVSNANSATNTPGEKGAQIYCFMRNNGNRHEVSWNASYALIKRQTNSLFKTSPKHAAVMIIESVVQNPKTYPNCGQYLGDLFENNEVKATPIIPKNNENRYNY